MVPDRGVNTGAHIAHAEVRVPTTLPRTALPHTGLSSRSQSSQRFLSKHHCLVRAEPDEPTDYYISCLEETLTPMKFTMWCRLTPPMDSTYADRVYVWFVKPGSGLAWGFSIATKFLADTNSPPLSKCWTNIVKQSVSRGAKLLVCLGNP